MSCLQLHPHQTIYTEVRGEITHLKHWTPGCLTVEKEGVGVNGQGMYGYHLRGSSALSNVSARSNLSE